MRAIWMVVLLALALPMASFNMPLTALAEERIEVAQNNSGDRRTLFDILFGRKKEQPKPQQQPAPKRSSPSVAAPVKVNTIEKAPDATRLLVIGDSLSIDLAKGLDRFYAEDPQLKIIGAGVGSSGFVRDDYYDWNKAIGERIAADDFDMVVVAIGTNDRQVIRTGEGSFDPLTDGWRAAYRARLSEFHAQLKAANKPVVWLGLPPMRSGSYSSAMSQISSIHRLVAFEYGAEYVDIYERFVDEDGNYSAYGPDLNGQNAQMRKGDGIHFTARGNDKLAFFVDKSIKTFYRGGSVTIAVADPLENSDAAQLQRPPFQGLSQVRMLEVAGAVRPLGEKPRADAGGLVMKSATTTPVVQLEQLMAAPIGRADAFGVGVDPAAEEQAPQLPR
ncbi:SGNH/GDSL hydrolase family protein [Maritalea mediterranea]|uniref:DUF459 domain-containing protein n=1 Tax=Maritalea mediterranea TaxID=2909667 RepID=A0ABS9E9S3_9HYPH|nr:SGNH family hydrolase [Maritalea mediterranea]MCF4099587.1 DUF459 domain-containing protein [Maritalea mediterranea]